MPKKNRLTKKEIEHVLRHGTVMRTPFFLIRYCAPPVSQSSSLSIPDKKYAVIVSKKVAPTSVERHSIRRAAYRTLYKYIATLPPFSVAITVLHPHTKNRAEDAYESLPHTLVRLHA